MPMSDMNQTTPKHKKKKDVGRHLSLVCLIVVWSK